MDKIEIEKELNGILRLYKACLDRDYLKQICAEKGLLKKANDIIIEKNHILSFENKYKELLEYNSSSELKVALIKKFSNKRNLNKNGSSDNLEDLSEKELNNKIDQSLKEESLVKKNIKKDNLFQDPETLKDKYERGEDARYIKKDKVSPVKSKSEWQMGFEMELLKVLKNLRWSPKIEFLDPSNPKKKLRGAFVDDKNVPHIYLGNNESLKDIGNFVSVKVNQNMKNFSIPYTSSEDIVGDVLKRVLYGESEKGSNFVKFLQDQYNKSVEKNELPLNIAPFLRKKIESRIIDVLKIYGNFWSKKYQLQVKTKEYKKIKSQLDALKSKHDKILFNIKLVKEEISLDSNYLEVSKSESQKSKINKRLRENKKILEDLNNSAKEYEDELKELETNFKSISKQLGDIESYIRRKEDNIEKGFGLEIVRKDPSVDSDSEISDFIEKAISTGNEAKWNNLLRDDIPEEYINEFKTFLKSKLSEIIKKNPNVNSKEDLKEFIDEAVKPFDLEKNEDIDKAKKDTLNNIIKGIPDNYLVEFKKDLVDKLFDIYEENPSDENFIKKFQDQLDVSDKVDSQWASFIRDELPDRYINDFMDFTRRSLPKGKKSENAVAVLAILLKDPEITVKDKKKIKETLSEEDFSDKKIEEAVEDIKMKLIEFAEEFDLKTIIQRMWFRDLLPASKQNLVYMLMNKEEVEEYAKDRTKVPERLLNQKNKYLKYFFEKEEERENKEDDFEKELEEEIKNIQESISSKEKENEELFKEDIKEEKIYLEKVNLRLKKERKRKIKEIEENIENLNKKIKSIKKSKDNEDLVKVMEKELDRKNIMLKELENKLDSKNKKSSLLKISSYLEILSSKIK